MEGLEADDLVRCYRVVTAADGFDDLIRYDLDSDVREAVLTTSRSSPRFYLGMASSGGILYVFGCKCKLWGTHRSTDVSIFNF